MSNVSVHYAVEADLQTQSSDSEIDYASASGSQLYFSCFLGDIEFSVGDADFTTRFGWVSVLGFALAFHNVLGSLAPTDDRLLDFQEDARWIRFQRIGDRVAVTSSYAAGEGHASYDQLLRASAAALRDLLLELRSRHPRLLNNQTLKSSLAQLNFPDPART